MIKRLITALPVLVLSFNMAVAAPLSGQETYDLLFRDGTLDDVSRDESLIYDRVVRNALNPGAAERDTGQVALFVSEGEKPLARLEFRQNSKSRALGQFPASVGNPMIMFFYETVVRDMAESAGGSAFYIRNRVKEALVAPNDVETGEAVIEGQTVPTQIVRIHPFERDPNRDRMKGFADLTLTVTMSEAVPGWYVSLVAEAPVGDGTAVYHSQMRFERLEDLR